MPRLRADEGVVHPHVGEEDDGLCAERPAHHALVQREAVAHLRVAALGEAPEAVVVEGVDAGEHPGAGSVAETLQRLVDRLACRGGVRQRVDRILDRAREGFLRDQSEGRCGRGVVVLGGAVYALLRRVGDVELRVDVEECVEDDRVEMGAAAVAHHGEGLLDRKRGPIGPVAREGVEHVGDGRDPAFERYVLPVQSTRIAGAVVALVVGERDRGGEVEQLRAGVAQHLVADLGVLLHRHALRLVERPGLEQQVVADGDLADVVQWAGKPQVLAERVVEAEASRHVLAHGAHPFDVPPRRAVALLGGARQAPHHLLVRLLEREL